MVTQYFIESIYIPVYAHQNRSPNFNQIYTIYLYEESMGLNTTKLYADFSLGFRITISVMM